MSKASRKFHRTIVLALAAMAALVWVAVDQFGISTEDMTTLFFGAVLVTVAVMLCALVFTVVWLVLRRLLRHRNPD